ncbi:MAG: hypothetical protein H6707_01315 [Deltaproteobacteria bacterium]|nr:hypothetical protein [Deltaproteobacteria bacterium]
MRGRSITADVVALDARQKYLADFRQRNKAATVLARIAESKRARVLVVGEAIIDEYRYCTAIGKSSKEPTLVVKALSIERFAGGSLAIANHLAAFCDRVTLLTYLGSQNPQELFIRSALRANVQPHFVFRPDAPTIVKRRFIDDYFFHKLFEVYEINDDMLAQPQEDELQGEIERLAGAHDLVVVCDFGHGMLSDSSIGLLRQRSAFMTANAQSNAGNLGYHTISKYAGADYVSTSTNEILLESRDRHADLEQVMPQVAERLGLPRLAVTRGVNGSLCYGASEGFVKTPAFADNVVDRVGAGDAFFSITSLLVGMKTPLEIAAFVGNVAGAQAVATVGNRRSVDRGVLLEQVEALLD